MVYLSSGFKLKDFLRENETLSAFLRENASFTQPSVEGILEAQVNLEKVSNICVKYSESVLSTYTAIKASTWPIFTMSVTQASHLLYYIYIAYSTQRIFIIFPGQCW